MKQFSFYEAQQNKDLTEGKGPMIAFALFDNELDAVVAVKGKGVMGVGDGEVSKITLNICESIDEYQKVVSEFRVVRKVYGYRKNWQGQWDYGFVDNRDAPTSDPEYSEFLRLQAKFG